MENQQDQEQPIDKKLQRLLSAAQELYTETTMFIQEILENLQYLYVNYENNPDVVSVSNGLKEVEQKFNLGKTDPELLYRQLVHIHERARNFRDHYVSEGERQRHFNAQTIEENFNWLYGQMELIDTKVTDLPQLQSQFERLYNKVDTFYPSDHSMRNTEYSKKLRDRVREFVKLAFGSLQNLNLHGELCPICNTLLNEQPFYKFVPCEHLFHKNCMSRWNYMLYMQNALPQEPQCPSCGSLIESQLLYNS